ncbi:MAG: hypothetical protein ABMA15_11605 [Vicinamibacterales bacterium]
MKQLTRLLVVVWFVTSAVLAAQDETVESRLEHVAGVKADAAEEFLKALRRAVGQNDHPAACEMLAYPLSQGDAPVSNAADCEARYDAIFTVPVRRAIGKQQFEELFVNQSGAMVGIGELWFAGRCSTAPCQERRDIRVVVINSQPEHLLPPKGKVLLACSASGQRLRVSADGSGGASLGVWYSPRFTGAPEREFPRAEPPGPPSECGSRTWTFTDGTRTYTVSELPCDAYLSPPPMGSVGRVTLNTAASPDGAPLWCRE